MNVEEAVALYRSDLHQALGRSAWGLPSMLRALEEHGGGKLVHRDDDVMVWSDLHLGHENIIRYTHRPFIGSDEMNRSLWQSWNAIVNPSSVVVCLGDVAMGECISAETWARVRAAPGIRKILVIGNHDLTNNGRLRVEGFDEVRGLLLSDGEPPLIWTHAPLPSVPVGHVNIHGHLHDEQYHHSAHINVSVEQLEYRPVSLVSLRKLAQALAVGHHPAGRTTLERLRNIGAVRKA